jgi:hypothetical protein
VGFSDTGGIYVIANKKSGSHRAKAKHAATDKKAPTRPHAADHSTATATIDRRAKGDRRSEHERRTKSVPVVEERRVLERRVKVNRRRQIDPTTCERDYTPEEVEFMSAMDEYKRRNGRMFPTCSEVLEVVKSLGYVKSPKAETEAENTPATLPVVDLPVAAEQVPTIAG